jgi:protein SMG7
LISHPFARESKDAELNLWMHTSYAFITSYKQRIANLSAPQPPPRGGRQAAPREHPNAPVERRKLLSRFRQFLSEEEKFWVSLVTWSRRTFDLHEVQPILVSLEMVSEDNPETGSDGRNRGYLFPHHSDTVFQCTPEQHQGKLSSVSKALIFLGDIARYKEQYNESGGRPKAGVETGPPARTSGKNKKTPIPRARDYEKARQRYEQARVLVPHEGNPSNQLAILSAYQMDTFNAIVHYYRAICVQQPYDTAAENMGKALKRSLDFWNTKGKTKQEEATLPRIKIEVLKEQIIALHAYWGQYQGAETVDPESLRASEELCKTSVSLFHDLIAALLLQSEVISKIVVIGLGALWKHRMLRSPGAKRRPRFDPRVEAQISGHLLAVYRSLLEVGLQELADDPAGDTDDIAQKISATLRRMLPALRMVNKWLRTNYRFYASDEKKHPVEGVTEFWKVYTRFFTALGQKFPIDQLTQLETPLDEDLDIRGFLPLTKLMVTEKSGEGVDRAQVHPNEEQLMRIWDLLSDAKTLAQTKVSRSLVFPGTLLSYPLRIPHSRTRIGYTLSRVKRTPFRLPRSQSSPAVSFRHQSLELNPTQWRLTTILSPMPCEP